MMVTHYSTCTLLQQQLGGMEKSCRDTLYSWHTITLELTHVNPIYKNEVDTFSIVHYYYIIPE